MFANLSHQYAVATLMQAAGEHLHKSPDAAVRPGRIAVADESDFHWALLQEAKPVARNRCGRFASYGRCAPSHGSVAQLNLLFCA
jgi:hypothetical protein